MIKMDSNWTAFIIIIALICFSIVGLFFIENNKPLCTMQMGINADINLQTDLVSNVSINNISIQAPCGEDLEQLYINSFKRFA
jgi:hypothetical protein